MVGLFVRFQLLVPMIFDQVIKSLADIFDLSRPADLNCIHEQRILKAFINIDRKSYEIFRPFIYL